MSEDDSLGNDPNRLDSWYLVEWDETAITRKVSPPGKDAWSDQLPWSEITRVCFEVNDVYASDCIYLFIQRREESFAIPTEAKGGAELWSEIIRRGLFEAKLATQVVSSGSGIFCWPEME